MFARTEWLPDSLEERLPFSIPNQLLPHEFITPENV
ncbi:hypothetical protein SMB34_01430 [Thalassospira permensis NBRC 106175]|jgi:hypothetical protein|uniref:Uncharacterized protein n=1 Tax=Thalassospira permensis NBRC 106175 TaxID=1353532 RepID=A0ABR4TU53_9PROT|nr:hypothetical protein SMB34_01430 [Thalassospira permensis NBRC 106175]|tara:strand:- start:392 stop:499 length:108 start_codon:yes stop_codon:yes gene_type:complete